MVCVTCRWLTSKEIHKEDIKYWRREIPHSCVKCISIYLQHFFSAQEHYVIHQVEDIELCGPVHSRSMWMVERNLKFMKGLVRQWKHAEGSIMEGYMVYQNMLYVCEYLLKLALELNLRRISDPDSNNYFEGEYLKGKGRSRKVKGNY